MTQVSVDQRGRLLMSTERLNQSTDRIKDSRRTMLETEELGVSILQDLHQQRQSLLHAHNAVCLKLWLFLFGAIFCSFSRFNLSSILISLISEVFLLFES